MLIYRFRITAHDHDEFLRDIEILPNQSFLDFHYMLVETAELKNGNGATFFMTDKKKKVNHEITLRSTKRQVRRYDDDLGEIVIDTVVMPLMKDAKIKNYIEDPHQTMNYEFHGREIIAMHIELFKIAHSENLVSNPRVARKTGELRKIIELPAALQPSVSDEVLPLPKIQKSKPVPVPKLAETSKLDAIEEDFDEIKAIHEELAEILEEEAPEKFEVESQIASGDDEEESGFGTDEQMEHIEDFGDMDQIDERYSSYRESSDD